MPVLDRSQGGGGQETERLLRHTTSQADGGRNPFAAVDEEMQLPSEDRDQASRGLSSIRTPSSFSFGPQRQSSLSSRPSVKWRSAAKSVMALQRMQSSTRSFAPEGQLPGLDVKRHNYDALYGSLQQEVNITCIDYSRDDIDVVANINNASLASFLERPRPAWSKVRWINVQGISWDVIQLLARKFDLHPLAVEDIVHIPQRIKADYYADHLFVSLLLISVEKMSSCCDDHGTPQGSEEFSLNPTSPNYQTQSQLLDRGITPNLRTRLLKPSSARQVFSQDPEHYEPLELMVEQASLFLLKDGTLLSLFQSQGERITKPIMDRLKGFKTLLTDSEDASFLFNCIVDGIVDHAMPLCQVYASRIAALEGIVLQQPRPKAEYTKELHLLSNDLNVLRRTLVPTQHLIHKLQSKVVVPMSSSLSSSSSSSNLPAASANNSCPSVPKQYDFLSPLTHIYLNDVMDHISTVVEDMDTLATQSKDLIDLIFNTINHANNQSMQTLAVVSTVFLPITFIAGVYGTNFGAWFPEIHWKYGYLYFWTICAVVTILFIMVLKRLGMLQ
eukprot:jgi/Chrzof1/3046/Cz12g09160.t1